MVGSYESFMLRVWHRAGATDHPWIGRLEHLPEGTVWTFHSPQDMLAALTGLLERSPGVPAQQSPAGGKSPDVVPLDRQNAGATWQQRLPRHEQGGQDSLNACGRREP
jgi:hypothetical protein